MRRRVATTWRDRRRYEMRSRGGWRPETTVWPPRPRTATAMTRPAACEACSAPEDSDRGMPLRPFRKKQPEAIGYSACCADKTTVNMQPSHSRKPPKRPGIKGRPRSGYRCVRRIAGNGFRPRSPEPAYRARHANSCQAVGQSTLQAHVYAAAMPVRPRVETQLHSTNLHCTRRGATFCSAARRT